MPGDERLEGIPRNWEVGQIHNLGGNDG